MNFREILKKLRGNLFEDVIEMLIKQLDPEDMRDWIEVGLDKLEDKAEKTATTLDDLALEQLRLVLRMPDQPDN